MWLSHRIHGGGLNFSYAQSKGSTNFLFPFTNLFLTNADYC